MKWRCLNYCFGYCKTEPDLGGKDIIGESRYRVEVDTCVRDWKKCKRYQTFQESLDDKTSNYRKP